MHIIRQTFRIADERGPWIIELLAHVRQDREKETETFEMPQDIETSAWPLDSLIKRLILYRGCSPDMPRFDNLINDLFEAGELDL